MNRVTKGAVLAAVVTAAVVTPAAGAARVRTETATYERASGIHLMDVVWIEVAGGMGTLPEVQPLAREKTVSIEITDDSGRPVAGVVHQGDEQLGELCGQTEAPLRLVSRKPIHLHVYSGPACGDVSTPTGGSVTFTFAR